MFKNRISSIIDTALLFIVTTFFTALLIGYATSNAIVIICSAVAVGLVVTKVSNIRHSKKDSNIDKNHFTQTLMQFYLKGSDYTTSCFYNALKTRYNCNQKDGYLQVNNTAVFIKLTNSNFSFDDFCSAYSLVGDKYKRIVIIATDFDKMCFTYSKSIASTRFKFINADTSYKLLFSLDALPPIEIEFTKENSALIKLFIKNALVSANCKKYLLTALLLVFSSLFMPSPLFYMIVSAICIALTVLSKLNIGQKIFKT